MTVDNGDHSISPARCLLSTSYRETDERNAARDARLWPRVLWRFRDPDGATELELRFDDTVHALLTAFARSVIHASEVD